MERAARSSPEAASRASGNRLPGGTGGAAHVDHSPRGAQLSSLLQLIGNSTVQRVIIGLEAYTDPGAIPKEWIDAYIADILDPSAHLYDDDITVYCEGHCPQVPQIADFAHAGDHWNITFKETGVTVSTAPDGSCGVHAIHAGIHLKNAKQADVPKNYAAPLEFVMDVRRSIHARVQGLRGEVSSRIAQEIKRKQAVAEAGFGPTLRGILTPMQEKAAREALGPTSSGPSPGAGGGASSGWRPKPIPETVAGQLAAVRKLCSNLSLAYDDPIPLNSMDPGRAQKEAQKYAAHLDLLRAQIQEFAESVAPGGYTCIVRFYVKDEDLGKTHPGLNSWAYHRRSQGEDVPETTDRKALAKQHMEFGHDADGQRGETVVKNSPFVSGSYDAKALVDADSPYNKKRGDALIRGSEVNEFLAADRGKQTSKPEFPMPSGRGGKRPDLRRSVLSTVHEHSSKSPSPTDALSKPPTPKAPEGEQRASGALVSDRIVYLTHGVKSDVKGKSDESLAKELKAPIATHVAFLLIPNDMTERPAEDTKEEMCCILEREITIYAPDTDLGGLVVFEVTNQLPKVTGRYGGSWK